MKNALCQIRSPSKFRMIPAHKESLANHERFDMFTCLVVLNQLEGCMCNRYADQIEAGAGMLTLHGNDRREILRCNKCTKTELSNNALRAYPNTAKRIDAHIYGLMVNARVSYP